jgi:cell division protease FtsH
MKDGPQKKGKDGKRSWLSNTPWLLILLLLAPGVYFVSNYLFSEPREKVIKYGEFIKILKTGDAHVRFDGVRVEPDKVTGKIITSDLVSDGSESPQYEEKVVPFRTSRIGLERDTPQLRKLLDERGVDYQGGDEPSHLYGIYSLLLSFLFIFVAILIGFLLFRWLMGGANSPLTFGRSRHKLYAEKDTKTTFVDVAGAEEAVAELREIVDFLKNPERYQALGGRIPKGVLLVGPPGTGKTLLARAVAGEADVPFFSMSGSDFVEMFVGVGASRVRDLFAQAENRAPCIIFIDELDALGKTRGVSAIGGHDEREQTLNQLLVEMDGFDSNRGVILMAATNRPETLDPALLRPGRFDRTVVVDRPDLAGREAILKVHTRNVKLADDADLRRIASMTPGSVGADLANIINEAALLAARKNRTAVSMADLEEAVERSQVGLERRSRIMSDAEKRRVAHHEAGHALVACLVPNADPVHKVTIIPRGVGALGYVLRRPEEERFLKTKSELEGTIKVALGGTIAEEIIYNEISNGATSDLEHANNIARRMVKEFGMSTLGRVSFPEHPHAHFLPGSPIGDGERHYSEETAREIDLRVREIIESAVAEVRGLLGDHRPALEAVALRLIEKEVIGGDELRAMLKQLHAAPHAEPEPALGRNGPLPVHREAQTIGPGPEVTDM